jgi:type IV secretory pathway VirB4 component
MTGKEKKALALEKWRNRHNVPRSAQETIPYQQMYRSGICLTEDGYYTKSIRFFDINYQLAQNEDRTAIFDNWCDCLNYFDSSIHVQLTFNNQHVDFTEYQRMIDLPAGNDNYDAIREEYTRMLRDQLSKGTNGLEKSKYITFGIQAKNLKEAKARLDTPDMLDFATAIPLSGFRFLLHMRILRGRENFRIYAFPIA